MKQAWILLVLLMLATSGCLTSPAGQATLADRAGHEAVKNGDYGTAMVHYKSAVELNPNYGPYFFNLGMCYRNSGQYREEIDALNKSLNLRNDVFAELYPDAASYARPRVETMDSLAWAFIGMAYCELGQIDSAITSTRKAIEIVPDDVDTFLLLSAQYFKNKQYDLSIKVAMRALELKPGDATAYNNIGSALYEKKQYDEAVKALKKAIELDPKMPNPYVWLSNVFKAMALTRMEPLVLR